MRLLNRKEAEIHEDSNHQELALKPLQRVKERENEDQDTKQREHWSHKLDFFLSCVGYAVGAGNIYRFPYLCFRNGGGAFLIPYFSALFLCGMPLFFLELAMGQFSGKGALYVWDICPLFKGLGYGMVIVSSIVTSYYNLILTWILYYLFKSCGKSVPWSDCNNAWNTDVCRSFIDLSNATDWNKTVSQKSTLSSGLVASDNNSLSNQAISWNSPATEFWRYKALHISSGIDEIGPVQWEMFGFYILGWAITFFCLFKGVKSMGKVAYVTATVPYILLTILLVRGVLLPGAMDGIKYYLIPDWKKLLNLKVWTEAYLQIFYSLGPAWGGLVTMASHNKFNNNCLRDAIMIPIINSFTSFYGGFVIFAVAGYMAHLTGKTVEEVGASGLGLTFIAYPEAIANMPISPLWAILFFLMMLSLCIDSQFGMFETMVGSIIDTYPKFLRKRKTLFTAAVCIVEILFGFILCSRAGYYFFNLVDWYVGVFSLMLISCMGCFIIYWIYGIDRFYNDIYLMLGTKLNIWWKICWGFVSPGLLLLIWIYNLVNYGKPYYLDYVYPTSAVAFGWMTACVSTVPLFYFAVKELLKQDGSLKERLLKSLQPSTTWGPSDDTIEYKPVQSRIQSRGLFSICPQKSAGDDAHQPEKTSLQNQTFL